MEAACDHGVQQGELVVVVVVEGGAIHGCGFGDVLDGDFFETAGLHEAGQSSLKELAGAADARVEDFAVGDRHESSSSQGTKQKEWIR